MDEQLNRVTKSWAVSFQQLAERALGRESGQQVWQKYHSAFPIGYQAQVSPRYALKDILHLEQLYNVKTSRYQSTEALCGNSALPAALLQSTGTFSG